MQLSSQCGAKIHHAVSILSTCATNTTQKPRVPDCLCVRLSYQAPKAFFHLSCPSLCCLILTHLRHTVPPSFPYLSTLTPIHHFHAHFHASSFPCSPNSTIGLLFGIMRSQNRHLSRHCLSCPFLFFPSLPLFHIQEQSNTKHKLHLRVELQQQILTARLSNPSPPRSRILCFHIFNSPSSPFVSCCPPHTFFIP